ncbi:MAG: FAD-dependent oxidoreductase [Bordetella sp.]
MATKKSTTCLSVAVVGAGMAGASAAVALHQAGHKVTLFEKSRGPSGRMSTRRTDDWQADHGAQYFTAKSAAFQAEVEAWCQNGCAAPWQGRIVKLDVTNASSLDAEGPPTEAPRFEPTPPTPRFVGTPRMTSIVAAMVAPLTLKTQTTINNAQRVNDQWQLHSKEHGKLQETFGTLIWAIPRPQLAPFEESFPSQWQQVLNSIEFAACWAVMVGFDATVNFPFDGLFVGRPDDDGPATSPLSWAARTLSKPGRTGQETWTLHASYGFTQQHLDDTPEAMAERLSQAFQALGASAPTWATAHRWLYALAESTYPLAANHLWDEESQLGICGDWLTSGRVEGAWQSGSQLASKLLHSPK